jgi:hypothetical protein
MGDRTVNADVTPPTVSSNTPLEGATAVAKASGLNIDFVMSEPIMPSTAIKSNVQILKTTDLSQFTNFTVSYLSASNTIRITTSAALTASTEYAVILGTGVKDANGNALAAPNRLKFTTGT